MDKSEIFLFQVERNIKTLYKAFLSVVEELKDRHDESMSKLEDALPNEKYLIGMVDSFSEDEIRRIRKKVLDGGNDCMRNIDEAAKSCGIKR